jgi:putative two-component system response regulator
MSERILVVDDDPGIRRLVVEILEDAGFTVCSAADGKEAIDEAAREPPELVLLDLHLPRIDGWQVQAWLQRYEPNTPVVLMTAGAEAREEAEANHAAGYLVKPFDLDTLLQTVAKFAMPPPLCAAVPLRAPLEAEVSELLGPSASGMEAIAGSLIRALWMKDVGTAAHSLRVANYALQLARQIGINGEERRLIGLGALLHDVGKVGVRDAVLLKPGPLNDREWGEMRAHALYGRRLLEPLEGTEPVWGLVYTHHERLDGLGYPVGLSAPDLTTAMRIVIVTDAFDAMTSHRPHRAAMMHGEAVVRLRANAGTQFDADLVRVFVEMLEGAVTV